MEELIFDIEQEEDGGYVAEAKISAKEQIVTQGDTLEELKMMIKDAIECHFDRPEEMPKSVRLHFVKVNDELLAFA